MDELLSPTDLKRLTGRARVAGQAEMLKSEGIPYRLVQRRLLVSRIHMRDWLKGKALPAVGQPNMAAIR